MNVLPAQDMADAVGKYFATAAQARAWTVETTLDWTRADAGRLTEGQLSAVEFITVIEDHLPGYFSLYTENFPVDASVEPWLYEHNRELYHFTVRWAAEEDTHARALARYQVASGMRDEAGVRERLIEPGQAQFELPFDHPVQFFAYALVQEKATQIYYQQLRAVAGDPVLAEVLTRLSRDEARHFTFMADVVSAYLRVHGDAVLDPIRAVIAEFRMPLAGAIRGYWRWALKIADTARYDHTDAYEHLINVMNRAVDTPSERLGELVRFVGACRTIA
ncbi:acyl-ACP desaturase [Amycolatopsis pithecellobii]|uniref:Acyl-ACP desaturase n=1 Tax=Amycolatopsis pithecellobii TaxID=664692 RepID=A0A6N7Z967_9PSEU|nr:acyl-ACP desaturase [Amycolatopsis pithecellobii]MTD58236.1 acyl-ACP desaturase [Amycolatopsis pithecellobii]